MQRAACPSSNPVNVLVALRQEDPGAEHPADVGVALVKPLMDDGVDEWRAWEQQSQSDRYNLIPTLLLLRQHYYSCAVHEQLPLLLLFHPSLVLVLLLLLVLLVHTSTLPPRLLLLLIVTLTKSIPPTLPSCGGRTSPTTSRCRPSGSETPGRGQHKVRQRSPKGSMFQQPMRNIK